MRALRLSLSLNLILLSFFSASCVPFLKVSPTPTALSIEAEEEAVYAALFDELYGEPQMLVLAAETETDSMDVENTDAILEYILSQMGEVDQATVDSFRVRNDASYPLRPDMNVGLPYVLLTDEQVKQIFDINTSGWDLFYTRYPNSPGLTTVSRVGFNTDFTQALVYIGTQSHWLIGSGYYVLLKKIDGKWEVLRGVMIWIS